jgi:hypothetical protein
VEQALDQKDVGRPAAHHVPSGSRFSGAFSV